MIVNKIQDSDLQSFNVEHEIIVDKNVIGEFIKDTAELVVFNENHKYDSLDKNYIDITGFGEWYVEEIENDEENESLTLKLCDKSREFDEDYEDTFPFPTTMKEWAIWIGNKVGIPLKGSFLNEDLVLSEKPYMGNNPKWRNAVKIIAKYASSWADMNNDGTYSIRWFEDKIYQIDDWEKFKHGLATKPTNVLILSTGVTESNVRWPETLPDDPHELRIEDDWTNINRYEINEAIYNQVNGFFYTPISDLALLYGIFELVPGQKIKTKDIELRDIETYISGHTLTWDGGNWEDPESWTSTLKMLDLKETTTKYQYSNSIENRLGRAEVNVDKNNKKIDMVTEDINEIQKNITISKQSIGNPIEVNDAGEYELKSIEIELKQHQSIYEGSQLVDLSNATGSTSNTSYKFEDDVLTQIGTNKTYPTTFFDITNVAKENVGKTLHFSCESYDYSKANKPNVGLQINRKNDDGSTSTSYITLFDYNGKSTPYVIPNDLDNIVYIRFRFLCNNTATTGDYFASWIKPMLSFKENAEYIPYGTWIKQIAKDKEGNINYALINMNIYDDDDNIIGHHELSEGDKFKDGILTKNDGTKVTLEYDKLMLHKGYNYITLNNDLNMNIEYLVDSLINGNFATKEELTISENNISLEVSEKYSNLSGDISNINGNIAGLEDSIAGLNLSSKELQIYIQNVEKLANDINADYTTNEDLENHVPKEVTTTTGYTFGANGLVFEKTDAQTKIIINEQAVDVKDSSDNSILYAGYDKKIRGSVVKTSNLIINNDAMFQSFEDFNNNKAIGCFWMGE